MPRYHRRKQHTWVLSPIFKHNSPSHVCATTEEMLPPAPFHRRRRKTQENIASNNTSHFCCCAQGVTNHSVQLEVTRTTTQLSWASPAGGRGGLRRCPQHRPLLFVAATILLVVECVTRRRAPPEAHSKPVRWLRGLRREHARRRRTVASRQ